MRAILAVNLLLLGIWATLGTVPASAQSAQRPNILFIYADDQNTRTVGCYPESWSWVKTPNIDALARSGVRFAHCYLGSWCMPSRASLLTGHYPHGIQSMSMAGTYPGSSYDPKQCPFWPSVFRQHGYQTAHIGKWHTGVDTGFGRDWDYQIVWNRPKNPDNAGNYYKDQILEINGVERRVEGYTTDNYTQWACEYIRGEHRSAEKPWYLWLCYGAIHGPSTPAPRHLGKFANEPVDIPADILGPRPEKPAYLDRAQAWDRGSDGQIYAGKSAEKFGDEENRNQRKTYQAWVRQVNECTLALDEGVGKVLEALRASGQLENTLVIYTADQGFSMGEHGFRAKLAPYEANYNSPLIVSWAKHIPEDKVSRVPVSGPDLVQTFFATAKIPLPWSMHGRDISSILANPEQPAGEHVLLYEHMGQMYGDDTDTVPTDDTIYHSNVPRWIAIRYGKYKYIRTLIAGEMEEIYDVEADPKELTNLALRPGSAKLLADLRQKAIAELKRTQAGFADALPRTKQMQ